MASSTPKVDEGPHEQAGHSGGRDDDWLVQLETPQHAQADQSDRRRRTVEMARWPRITTEPVMAPVAAAVAPWTNAFNCALSRWRLNQGESTATGIKTGRKMPMAARLAPGNPATR